jgi:2-deoxy-D-gluconate 3-dehydrogenase
VTSNLFDLIGQNALVTGGSGGLGRAIAEGLKEAGAAVAISGASERVADVASELGCVGLRADLAQRAELRRLFDDALAALGQLDILVAAHGITTRHKAEDFPIEEWDNTLEVNLTSVFALCQLAGQHMLARGRGKIITIASMLSFSGGVTVPAYAASKGGVAQMTKALANEWAGRGVNVNAIAPGYFDTPLAAGVKNDPVRYRQVLERLPAGRWGQPSDLKGAVVFLASRASDYVHGILLPVDGGWLAR